MAQTALANGADCLAIATLAEGVELRQAGINVPILILGAINAPEDIQAIAAWQLEPTICNPEQALVVESTMAKVGTSLPVHLKLDTGMSRLGTNWQEATSFVQLVQQLSNLQIASIYSHCATAEESDRTMMNLQHHRFRDAIKQLKKAGYVPPLLHLANSAATLSDRSYHYDWLGLVWLFMVYILLLISSKRSSLNPFYRSRQKSLRLRLFPQVKELVMVANLLHHKTPK